MARRNGGNGRHEAISRDDEPPPVDPEEERAFLEDASRHAAGEPRPQDVPYKFGDQVGDGFIALERVERCPTCGGKKSEKHIPGIDGKGNHDPRVYYVCENWKPKDDNSKEAGVGSEWKPQHAWAYNTQTRTIEEVSPEQWDNLMKLYAGTKKEK